MADNTHANDANEQGFEQFNGFDASSRLREDAFSGGNDQPICPVEKPNAINSDGSLNFGDSIYGSQSNEPKMMSLMGQGPDVAPGLIGQLGYGANVVKTTLQLNGMWPSKK